MASKRKRYYTIVQPPTAQCTNTNGVVVATLMDVFDNSIHHDRIKIYREGPSNLRKGMFTECRLLPFESWLGPDH
eukprot:1145943-Amphidinium_carterae.1